MQKGGREIVQAVGALRLNLGCSDRHLNGFRNVDICPPADEIVDLTQPWPWQTNSVERILAHDIVEHLPDPILTMNEAWRVLEPGGLLEIFVPTTEGRGAWQDPTHRSWWNRNSFLYYTAGEAERERFGKAYGIQARFDVIQETESLYPGKVTKLKIVLRAVK